MSPPFHFVVFLCSFLIREASSLLYADKKTFNSFSNIYHAIYQQRVIAGYINYGSRPSKTLGSESEIMWGMAKFRQRTKKSEGHVRSVTALHHLVAW